MSKPYLPIRGEGLTALLVTLFRLNGALLGAGDTLVSDLGLTSSRWQVLGVVANAPAPLPIASIARNMGLTRQGVRQVVNDLVTSGIVELAPNLHHRRANLVVLTPAGERVYQAALERWQHWLEDLGRGTEPGRIDDATRLLQSILARLDERVPTPEKAATP